MGVASARVVLGRIRSQGVANGRIGHCLRRSRRNMDSRVVGLAVFRSARSLAAQHMAKAQGRGGASEDSYEGVTLIKPNLAELSDLLGVPLENDGARPAACRELTTDGSAEVVALQITTCDNFGS